ncbi:MAG TPA: glycosyltransferase family 2 protein, partial [Chryseosolibacter sp.]
MVYIIIPVFNRKEFTRTCLLSLERQTLQDHKIIVVDDGSTDGTKDMIREEFPDVTVLFGNGSLYWTASVNLGIRHALSEGAEYIMTLNNDTVAEKHLMEKMRFWSQEKPQALLGALDIDSISRRPYYGGEIVHRLWNTSTFLLNKLPERDRTGLHKVSLFPGRGLLIPRNVFETIGLFEQNKLPHYMADYDFTRMAADHGFEIFCNY